MQLIKFYTGRDRQDHNREDFTAVDVFEQHLITLFDGFTRTDTWGGWQDEGHGPSREKGYTYECLAHQYVGTRRLRSIATRMLVAFDQDTILYTIQHSEKGGYEYGSVTA